jgi:hypothetical protein
MANQRKKRKKGFYLKVAEAIIEGSPFDVSKSDGGWTKVSQLITLYMLRNLSEADKYKVFNDYLVQVEHSLDHAINYINDHCEGLHVHKFLPEGKRNNEFISIKKYYRNADSRNADRVTRRAVSAIKVAKKEIEKTLPDKLPELKSKTQRLLNGETQ